MTTTTKTVTCDLFGREIKKVPFCGELWGHTYIISGIFGAKAKADICDDCKEIIRTKRIESEKEGGVE